MKIALQLFTIRDCIQSGDDLREALKRVKAMGYEGVEFAGYAGLSPEEVRAALDEAGIPAVSSHEGIDRLESSLDEIIAYSVASGAKHLACAFARTSNEEEMARVERVLKAAKAAAAPHGITVSYHNHSHEFRPLPDGTLPIDRIRACSMLEPDTYWVFNSKLDPAAFLREHADEIALVHLKDGDREGHPCTVGEGANDMLGILRATQEIGKEWIIVENDKPTPDGLSDAKRSIDWIRNNFRF